MGAYLPKPITDKISSDEEDDKLKIGASSMQGWRETQEDAHNSILDFDENTYFFSVYDGHGGREVALYCSQKLPQFIKNTEAYKNGNLEKALIDGFLGFDATLTSEEVIAELRQLMDDCKEENDVSDEENMNQLYEEASMPLDEVIEKYMHTKKPVASLLKDAIIRQSGSSRLKEADGSAKDTTGDSENLVNSSSSSDSASAVSSESSAPKEDKTLDKECIDKKDVPKENRDSKENNIDSIENSNKTDNTDIQNIVAVENNVEIKIDTTKSNENEPKDTPTKEETSQSKPQENGKISKKGKALAKTKGIITPVKKTRPKRTAKQLYLELLHSESESESEDEEDKTFQGPIEKDSSDEENTNVAAEDSEASSKDDEVDEEEDIEQSDEEEEEEDEDDEHEDDEHDLFGSDVPGTSSGCTAVVALMRGTKLYVANAGDSRCIVCRDGKAVDMSVDHKPEDNEEYQRITKAGGRVNFDGRVNGGLNLSRAIGDHSYKLNKDLPDREQMITALPDIKTYTVTPADEFIVLACDGIWNFMSSQEVADFVKCRLEKKPEKLSQICEELFDNCLASNTLGDGTGCDNMTAIIINFKSGLFKRSSPPSDTEESNSPKRAKTDAEHVVQQETTV